MSFKQALAVPFIFVLALLVLFAGFRGINYAFDGWEDRRDIQIQIEEREAFYKVDMERRNVVVESLKK